MKTLMGLAGLTMAGFMLLSCNTEVKEANYQIIPLPQEISVMDQAAPFILSNGTKIMYPEGNEKMQKNAEFLASYIKDLTGKSLAVQAGTDGKGIILQLVGNAENPEGYQLKVTSDQVVISGPTEAGVFYGIQTLRKSIPVAQGVDIALPAVEINDYPRFSYRGAMLDVSRHFFPVDSVKRFIDMLALHNINRFHWHLTEGLGWRVEIKQYTLLTQKGAYAAVGEEQQGFYSQEEIKSLVDYAAARNITIVPEIDMPGHAEAALHSYPELGCFNRPVEIPKLGFTPNIFCAGKEHTLQFLKNVLDEICTLFPSPYIHLGGDEAPKDNWNKCPDCQKRIADLGLKDSHDLQLWFSAQMAEYLKSKGKMAVFWGDVVYNDGYPLPDNIVIQWWNYRGHKDLALRNALRHHYPVICSTNYYTYLNFPLTPWKGYEQARTFDLKDVYMDNPSYKATQESNPLIRGMGCALWTDDGVKEYMIDRRLFPRILALAEQMWHNGPLTDFDTFYQRILHKKEWFENRGYGFGPALTEETDNNYKWE